MADMTFGVKVNEELKEKLTKLIKDSGLQGKDFMQNLVNLYEMENKKKSNPEIIQDINELQYLTSRINGIYLNLANRIENIKNSNNELYENELEKFQNKISSLEDKLKESTKINKDLKDDLNKNELNNKSLINKISELTEINKTDKLLIKEYNEKLYNLSEKINSFQKITVELDNYKKDLDRITKENKNLNYNIKNLELTMNEEINSRETKISLLEKNIEELKKDKLSEINSLKDKLSIEKEKSLLKLEKEYQIKINTINDECNSKIKSLLEELKYSNKKTPEDNSK